MALVFRQDSDNVTHSIMQQQQRSSCAVASIWMARCIAKRMSFAEGEWGLAWRLYSHVVRGMVEAPAAPAPMTFNPDMHGSDASSFGNMFSNYGTSMDEVVAMLRRDAVKVDHLTPYQVGTALQPARITDFKPALVLLGWYNGNLREGGHFIVAARRTRAGRIVYLDPGNASLTEGGPGPGYQSTGRFEQIAYLAP